MADSQHNRPLVWAMIAVQFAPPFMTSGVPVALPSMGAELGAGATSLGLVVTIYLASQVASLLPVGRLAASVDKNALCKLGILGFALATIVIGLISSVPVILGLALLQGVGSAIVAATAPAILADIVPADIRGRVYGRAMGAVYAGLTLGPMSAGLLTDLWGWRVVFLGSGGALLCLYVIFHVLARSTWRLRPSEPVHLPSTALAVVAVSCLVAGSATIREGALGYAYVAGGILLGAMFVILQRRIDKPLIRVDLVMQNRVLATALLVQLVLYLNGFCLTFLLSIYLQVALGHSAKLSGQIIAIGTVLMALMAPVAGHLADRYRPHAIASVGIVCVLVSTAMGLALDEQTGLAYVLVMLVISGLGWAFFSSPNMAIIMNSVPAAASSIASALAATARTLGMLSGMIITGVFISLTMGNEAVDRHPHELTWTVFGTCAVLTAVTAVILVVSLIGARQPQAGGG
jgi:MFS family permease